MRYLWCFSEGRLLGTGIYPNLPDELENLLEKNEDYKHWSFN